MICFEKIQTYLQSCGIIYTWSILYDIKINII